MQRIDRNAVVKVASLAYLQLSADEITYYQQELDRFIDCMQQLETATDILPRDWRADLAGLAITERVDFAQPSIIIEKVLSEAPKILGTSFQVPRIIE